MTSQGRFGRLGALLLRDYGVPAFTEYNRNVIRLLPPLICQREHVVQFMKRSTTSCRAASRS